MALVDRCLRQLFGEKAVGIILACLIAGSVLISDGRTPMYFPVLFTSGVRNAHFAWLGSGVLFDVVAFVFLYLEAVVLTAVYVAIPWCC